MKSVFLVAGDNLVKTSAEDISQKPRGRAGDMIIPSHFSDATSIAVGEEQNAVFVAVTESGKLYKQDVSLIKFQGKYDVQAIDIKKVFDLGEGDTYFAQTAIIDKDVFSSSTYSIVFATQQGLVKKTLANEFSSSGSSGVIAISLNEGDKVAGFTVLDESKPADIFLFSSMGNLCRINASEFKPSSRTAMGSYGMLVKEVIRVVSISSNVNGENLVWTICDKGKGKVSKADAFTAISKGKKVGVRTQKVTEKTGLVVRGYLVKEEEDAFILVSKRRLMRMSVADISLFGRSCEGVKLIKLHGGAVVLDTLKIQFKS